MSKHEIHNANSPGPCQCHPSITKTSEGCLPESILTSVARAVSIHHKGAGLRAKLEKHFDVEPENEYSFLMKLPLSQLNRIFRLMILL